MRDLTKAMTSYMWAMSLFGVQQMFNVFRPGKAAESFDNVTHATEDEFGDAMRATFRAGDNLQKGIVDLTFSVFTLGMFDGRGGGARGTSSTAGDVGRQSAEALRQGMRAVGQAADAAGQVAAGAGYYAADATRAAGGRGAADTRRDGGRWGSGGDLGRQAADAVGFGAQAVGQAVDAVGQTAAAAAYATADVARQATGWGTGGGGRSGGGDAGRGDAQSFGRQSSGQAGGQTQGWGPMPSQSSAGSASRR